MTARNGLKILFLILSAAAIGAGAVDIDTIKNSSKQKAEAIIQESTQKREKLLKRFDEFRADLDKLQPGLDIRMPIDPAKPDKMRMTDHNVLPGTREFPKHYAIVSENSKLKTWHSETEGKDLGKVSAGERVEVIMLFNFRNIEAGSYAWALVRKADSAEGYIAESKLKNIPEDTIVNPAKKEKKYVYIPEGLRMRSESSVSGEFLVLVPYNTDVMVTEYSRNKDTVDAQTDYWAKTQYEGHTGWLFNAYLRPSADRPPVTPPTPGPGGFSMPIHGSFRQGYGPRVDPITKKAGTMHRGIDIAAPKGEPIKAAKGGEVYENSYNASWGNYVIIKHDQEVYTLYCHQSKATARKGTRVSGYDLIGYVGSTGRSTGPHLHFEVWLGLYNHTDPLKYLPK